MVTRLLASIDSRIQASHSQLERYQLQAERAAVLARLGQLDAAAKQLDDLRKANVDYEPVLTARILLGEGMVDNFANRPVGAGDKFRRAYAISAAMGIGKLKALCAAWLGSNAFQLGNMTASAQYAAEALAGSDQSDHGTLARANLAVADLMSHLGDVQASASFYKVARNHAVEEGDLSMQSAILYNYAACRMQRLAVLELSGEASAEDKHLAELDISSIKHLDRGLGIGSLGSMVPLLHAQILVLCEQWKEALSAFDANIDAAEGDGMHREMSKLHAYRGLCRLRVGDVDGAAKSVRDCEATLSVCSDLDDLAIVHACMSEILKQLQPERAPEHLAAKDRCLQLFRDQQRTHLELVRGLLANRSAQ